MEIGTLGHKTQRVTYVSVTPVTYENGSAIALLEARNILR
jgi:hypothetical protein